jgi:hypothetical protein
LLLFLFTCLKISKQAPELSFCCYTNSGEYGMATRIVSYKLDWLLLFLPSSFSSMPLLLAALLLLVGSEWCFLVLWFFSHLVALYKYMHGFVELLDGYHNFCPNICIDAVTVSGIL